MAEKWWQEGVWTLMTDDGGETYHLARKPAFHVGGRVVMTADELGDLAAVLAAHDLLPNGELRKGD